jgi:acyl-coenzyme A thioesterase 13
MALKEMAIFRYNIKAMKDILDKVPPCFEFLKATMLEYGGGKAKVKFLPTEEMLNPFGIIQGGILAGMLDNIIGPAIFTLAPKRPTSTVQMNVNYLAAVKAGDELIGTAEVIHMGRSQVYVEAQLMRGDKLIAKATCTNLFLDIVPKQ